MKIEKKERTAKKHNVNLLVSDDLKNKVNVIKQDYNVSQIIRQFLNEFHADNYGK